MPRPRPRAKPETESQDLQALRCRSGLYPFSLTSISPRTRIRPDLPSPQKCASFGSVGCTSHHHSVARFSMTRKFSSSIPTSALATCAPSVLRNHGIQVDATDSLQAARSLWRPKHYELILLAARGHFPGEPLDFYVEIKHASPGERVVFLVGAPTFLSLTVPTEVMATEKEPQQWAETVRRFVTAA